MPFFFFTLGFTNAFTKSGLLPLPLIILFISTVWGLISKNQKIKLLPIQYYLSKYLFVFFIITIMSFFLQVQRIGLYQLTLNHLLSLLIIPIFFSLTMFNLLLYEVKIEHLLKWVFYGVLFVSLFTIIEFVLKNFTSVNFDSYILRPDGNKEFDALYNTGMGWYYRSRGLTSESGHNALYLLTFLPLGIYYMKDIFLKRTVYILIVFISVITTFSSAATFETIFVSIFLFLFYAIHNYKQIRIEIKTLTLFVLTSIIILSFIFFSDILTNLSSVFSNVFAKMDIGTSKSSLDRLTRWTNTLELIDSNYFFGAGPGISSLMKGTGSTNFYLEIFVETGILGFSFLMFFMINYVRKVFLINSSIKYYLIFSIGILLIHYIIIADYWYPWLWVILAITNYIFILERNKVIVT